MRISHATLALTPDLGGPYASIRGLSSAQASRGHEVSIVSPGREQPKVAADDWGGVRYSFSGGISVPRLGFDRRYAEALLETQPDVLHTQGLWQYPSWVATGLRRGRDLLHVASIRGMLEPWALTRSRLLKATTWALFERRNLAGADLLHATSAQEARSIRARGIESPIAVIPNGVEVPALDMDEEPREAEALFLSRIHPGKGVETLLEAWAECAPRDWTLTVAGGGEPTYVAEMKRRATALGLGPDQVSFPGPLYGEAKSEAFGRARLFVLPTVSENFGIAIAEALAHGVPVITTQGAPWKIIEEEGLGWWTPVGAEGLRAALRAAFQSDPTELRSRGLKGRQVMESRFSWDGVAARFDEVFEWLRAGTGKPDFVLDRGQHPTA